MATDAQFEIIGIINVTPNSFSDALQDPELADRYEASIQAMHDSVISEGIKRFVPEKCYFTQNRCD